MEELKRITAKTTFLHGTSRLEEGKVYDVPSGLAGYFIANGWAVGPDGEESGITEDHHIIEVHNSGLASDATGG